MHRTVQPLCEGLEMLDPVPSSPKHVEPVEDEFLQFVVVEFRYFADSVEKIAKAVFVCRNRATDFFPVLDEEPGENVAQIAATIDQHALAGKVMQDEVDHCESVVSFAGDDPVNSSRQFC